MDLAIIENMNAPDLRQYIQFLLWHYRVVDAFWYLKISEKYDETTADELNEKVWGRVASWPPKILSAVLTFRSKVWKGLSKPCGCFPGASLWGIR